MENGQEPPVAAPPIEMNEVSVSREPSVVLQEAHKAAAALKDVLSKKQKKVMMNGEQYLEFEDWQTVGKFYGITAKVVSTNPIEMGDVMGFEAKAVAYHLKTGQEISAADAMCLNDEPKWSTRAKYEWKGGQKVKVGEDRVPLFQLRSMAQTRACAKALRNCLAWVVVLAGYRPTPAEELPDAVQQPQERKQNPPRQAQAPKPQPVNYIQKLRDSIMDFSNNDQKVAGEILFGLTGKKSVSELNQTDAAAAQMAFEKKYLSVGENDGERAPGEEG